MSDVIDLDALMPEQVTIKFGNDEIQVNPPATADVLRIGFLGQKLQEGADLSDADIDKLVTELTAKVVKCVPGLDGKQLNTAQLLKLVEIISNMAMPPDAKELKKRGISTESPKAQ